MQASRSWSEAFPEAALDTAWRTITDSFLVLKLNHLTASRTRWVYEQALLYCERREDGICVGGVYCPRSQALAMQGVAGIIAGFHALGRASLEARPASRRDV